MSEKHKMEVDMIGSEEGGEQLDRSTVEILKQQPRGITERLETAEGPIGPVAPYRRGKKRLSQEEILEAEKKFHRF